MSTLKDDLKAEFTSELPEEIKPLLDTFYDRLADVIRKYSSNAKITITASEPENPVFHEIWIQPE